MPRVAKPLRLVRLEGNRGKQKLPKPQQEIRPAPVAPTCPGFLDAAGRAEWKRVSGELERLGLLTKVDMAALAGYCYAWSVIVAGADGIKRAGGLRKYLAARNSQTQPEMTSIWKAWDKVRGFCAEFGMTPSSRAKMIMPGAADDDEFGDLVD